MAEKFRRHLVDPIVIAVGIIIIVGIMIVVLGEALLHLYSEERGIDSFGRPELWLALGLAVAIIAIGAAASMRPKTARDVLDKEIVIGDHEFFKTPLPPVSERARSGPEGTTADIADGYTLYSANGALAIAAGVIPGGMDFGRHFAGFIYAHGLHGASDELWIPIEAVSAVYPETKSVFLAINGDETEFFGWNYPPEGLRRGPATAVKDPLRPESQ